MAVLAGQGLGVGRGRVVMAGLAVYAVGAPVGLVVKEDATGLVLHEYPAGGRFGFVGQKVVPHGKNKQGADDKRR